MLPEKASKGTRGVRRPRRRALKALKGSPRLRRGFWRADLISAGGPAGSRFDEADTEKSDTCCLKIGREIVLCTTLACLAAASTTAATNTSTLHRTAELAVEENMPTRPPHREAPPLYQAPSRPISQTTEYYGS